MKEVGDKFGAGELILPFVLQSAEVMKRAVAQLEKYLDKVEGYTKGTVVIATVFGDVHDIGKSLVNTILTNNGYTVVDLGKQVPIGTITEAVKEHNATAVGLSALLVSTSKQMPLAVAEFHQQGFEVPVLVGGAAINRNFGSRVLFPNGRESDEVYEPGVFYCKDAFEGLSKMDQLVDGEAREALVAKTREQAFRLRDKGPEPELGDTTDASVRSPRSTGQPVRSRRSGACASSRSRSTSSTPTSTRTCLFKLHWGGRGVKGEAWRKLVEGTDEEEGFLPRLERMWAEQDYLRPKAKVGYFPCNADGNELVIFDPRTTTARSSASCSRASPARPAVPRRLLPAAGVGRARRRRAADRHRGLRGHRRDGSPRAGGEFAEQLFTHGLGVQVAEGMAEWLHAKVRQDLGIDPDQGRRMSWGYPAVPEQSEHDKVVRLLDAERTVGVTMSEAHAPEPEQTTLAIITHHPQAIYFGMKSGRLVDEAKSRDAIIHDPRRRRGHRVENGDVSFGELDPVVADDGEAFEESREEAVEA
jgi:5-methyltetrahydrofolate--homocysteine methyltransferase